MINLQQHNKSKLKNSYLQNKRKVYKNPYIINGRYIYVI